LLSVSRGILYNTIHSNFLSCNGCCRWRGYCHIPINAQKNSSSVQSQNGTTIITTGAEEKTYVLIFGQRTVGNIDNSTKIVSSIVGNNTIRIQEEFLEEISLAPSQELEEQ
jgi:hypothetical protein